MLLRRYRIKTETTVAEPQKADLESMTKAELLVYAQEKNIDLGGASKKADILAKINEAETKGGEADNGDGTENPNPE